MADLNNTRIVLNSRPIGMPTDDNFEVQSIPVVSPGENEMLLRTLWLSLDPYMRGRMSDRKSYAKPLEIGEVITGGVVCQVVESNVADYPVGTLVSGMYGWQSYAIAKPDDYRLFKVDPELAPISTAVGTTGMPGQTAYFGLLNVGKPQEGETVVVSAASGAVGSVVGQIAKIQGCRAVGIAGGKTKCDYVVNELGFDVCIDYKESDFAEKLAAACPEGVDVYFENVGGEILEAVAPLLNKGARVPVCGFISAYNATSDDQIKTPEMVLGALEHPPESRFFVVTEWIDEFETAARTLGEWIKDGRLKYRETIVEGIENAPLAFRMLFTGENFGKLMIKVADLDSDG
ncbi:MAG: NADP-dependent oxidoreductase [bacterium]|nr:NADP-dependent oxidoreductase [Gammaproteobacteria bacterium]HIL95313.1 NADP-dependent oxidoreductase [Pseudomonadales bacterium]